MKMAVTPAGERIHNPTLCKADCTSECFSARGRAEASEELLTCNDDRAEYNTSSATCDSAVAVSTAADTASIVEGGGVEKKEEGGGEGEVEWKGGVEKKEETESGEKPSENHGCSNRIHRLLPHNHHIHVYTGSAIFALCVTAHCVIALPESRMPSMTRVQAR